MGKKVVHLKGEKIKKGGSEMEATIKYSAKTMPSVQYVAEEKSDWDEIAEWGCKAAKEKGFTKEDSRKLLKAIRRSMDECCR